MSPVLGDPVTMIEHGAPRLIHSDEELAEYTEALFALTGKESTTRSEDEAIDLLSLLIEKYEEDRYPIPATDPVAVLRLLMESHGLSQKDLVPELRMESTVSLVLAGKRELNKNHIARLSKRFHVSPAVFFGSV